MIILFLWICIDILYQTVNTLFIPFSVTVMKERLGSDAIRCVGYGHVGDGNMHLNITSKAFDKNILGKIEPFLYEWTSQVHGSISAEHGKQYFIRFSLFRKYFDI